MQGKGAIKFFAVAFALVCVFQLSFTLMTYQVENEASEYANGDKAAERRYLDSMMNETVYNLWVKEFTYQDCKEREINLGLDLKGGMHVTMEVSVVDLIKSLANNSTDATFLKALERAQNKQVSSQKDYVTLFGESFEEIDPNAKMAAIFATRELQERISWESTNERVLKVLHEEAGSAIDRSFQILRTRIDKFGVTSPNIQRQEGTGRIIVELPGVDNPERVRKLLQGTAKLEFWETFDNLEVIEYLDKANKILAAKMNLDDSAEVSAANQDSSALLLSNLTTVDTTQNKSVTDTSASSVLLTPDTSLQDGLSLLQKLGKDTTGDTSALSQEKAFEDFAQENPLFAVMSPAIYQDEQGQSRYREGPVVGYVLPKDTSRVNAYLSMPELRGTFPKNMRFLWGVKPVGDSKPLYEIIAIKTTSRNDKAPLEGDVVTDARQDFTFESGSPEIAMNMNAEGARTWKRLTAENIGKSIAIVLDNLVYSYPTVQSEIPSGRSSISGSFTINEAKDLANILMAGKMPAPTKIVQEEVVGPSLGKESIELGLTSLLIGLIAVIIFMVIYYSLAGGIADIALFVNIFFIMGVLASLQATLTLPGMAGIVLTMGMAVDANVLIYERIREEINNGKGIRLAVIDGYKMAFSSILDSNITTLLTGLILYFFGSGPIKGFATVLCIGILTSMFTAIFVSRLIIEWLVAKDIKVAFSIKPTERVFKNTNFSFVQNRKLAYIASGFVILCGIISFLVRGLNYGVDFKGGRSYVVQFDQDVNASQIRSSLTTAFENSATEVKSFGTRDQFKITTSYMIDDRSDNADSIIENKLFSGLASLLGTEVSFENFKQHNWKSSQKVGPTIADDIRTSAIWATVFSLLAIFIYIVIRFRKWQYGAGAVVALLHDALIVISMFSIFYNILPFPLEADQAFIAAILTVIGYSINDTVVIFDRIREHVNIHHGEDILIVANRAINKTLSRTVITSLTTFLSVLVLFIFGGDTLKGFSFALMIGIFVGTYSSIFVAAPLALDLATTEKQKESLSKVAV